MLYTGFTEHELQEIIAILDRNHVPYEVSANHQGIEHADATIKNNYYHQHRHSGLIDNSFYAITIDQAALKALPGGELLLLQEMRIYPEIDIPYQHEEIVTPALPKKKSLPLREKILISFFFLMFGYLGLAWIDDYVFPIFHFLGSIEWV